MLNRKKAKTVQTEVEAICVVQGLEEPLIDGSTSDWPDNSWKGDGDL